MWTINEIYTEMMLDKCDKKMDIKEIYLLIEKEGINTGTAFGTNNGRIEVVLGTCISDEDCFKLFGLK